MVVVFPANRKIVNAVRGTTGNGKDGQGRARVVGILITKLTDYRREAIANKRRRC